MLREVVQKGEKGFALVFEHYALVREGSLVGARLQPPAAGTAVQSPPSSGSADLLSPVVGQVSSCTVPSCTVSELSGHVLYGTVNSIVPVQYIKRKRKKSPH